MRQTWPALSHLLALPFKPLLAFASQAALMLEEEEGQNVGSPRPLPASRLPFLPRGPQSLPAAAELKPYHQSQAGVLLRQTLGLQTIYLALRTGPKPLISLLPTSYARGGDPAERCSSLGKQTRVIIFQLSSFFSSFFFCSVM